MRKLYQTLMAGLAVGAIFSAAQPAYADMTLNLTLTNPTAKDVDITVTPSDLSEEATFIVNVQGKDQYDSNGGDAGAIQNRKNQYQKYADNYGGTWVEYAPFESGVYENTLSDFVTVVEGKQYVIYTFGLDKEGNVTAPLVSKVFPLEEETPVLKGSFDFAVSDITPVNATITVTPTDVDDYVFHIMEKAQYDAIGGEDGAYNELKKRWDRYAELYDSPWTEFIDFQNGVQSYDADDFLTPEPGKEYVAYAFGIDDEGNMTSQVFSTTFSTEAVSRSEITFEIEVTDVKADENGTCTVTAHIVPSNDDPYGVLCQQAKFVDFYDFNDEESTQQYLDNQVRGYVKQTYTGEQTVTFTRMPLNKDMYIVAVGFNSVPNSAPMLHAFKSEPVVETPAFELAVSDIGVRDAYISVVPADNNQNYCYGVVTAAMVERAGGIDNIYTYHDKSWWEMLADLYGDTWTNIAAMYKNFGPIQGKVSETEEIELDWDTDYVLYAYNLDENYAPCSDIYTVEFRTLAPTPSDITFEVSLVQVVEDPDREGMNKATLHVVPSNDDPYANHVHEVYYYDWYVDNPNFTFDDYLEKQVYPMIISTRSGETDLTFLNIKPEKEYYLVSLGWNEGHSSKDFNLFRFSGKTTSTANVELAKNAVIGYEGAILIDGEYDAAAVFAADGKAIGNFRNTRSISAAPGMYIVKLVNGAQTSTHKVIVR